MQLYGETDEEKPSHNHYNSFADLLSITSGGPLSSHGNSTSPLETAELVESSSSTSIEIVEKGEGRETEGGTVKMELERANRRIAELTVGRMKEEGRMR